MTIIQKPRQSPHCTDCGSSDVLHIGKIPAANIFAGRVLPELLDGGHLWCCDTCHLIFRWPTLGRAELNVLYAGGAGDTWGGPPTKREDWHIAERWLHRVLSKGSAILDVGCFDGGFLDRLGDAYERYGIEIHPAACQRAETKGITMIGTNFESFSCAPASLDCITAFDVIEHVHQPAQFLKSCCDLVKPGGWIMVATGNADSPSFRFMGARYWYCTIAEHLSFISPRWCYRLADKLGLSIEEYEFFSHGRRNWFYCLLELIKNILYRLMPEFFAWLRQQGFGKKDVSIHPELAANPPGWMTAKDHFIILFRKR